MKRFMVIETFELLLGKPSTTFPDIHHTVPTDGP